MGWAESKEGTWGLQVFKAGHYILSLLDRWEMERPMDLGEINGALWKNILLGNEMLAAEHTLCVAAFSFFIGPSSVKVVTSCHHPSFVSGEGLVVEPFHEV